MYLSSKGLGVGMGLIAALAVVVGAVSGQDAPTSDAAANQGNATPGSASSGVLSEFSRESLRGLVTPGQRVTLGAPMGTQVKAVKVEEGERVKKGELLAEFDYEMQELTVALGKLEIKREEMRLDEAAIQLEKMQEALEENAVQEWEVRKKKLQRDGSKVALDRAKQNLELEQVKLDRYYVKAPFAGTIHRIKLDAGAALRQGDPIMSLVSLDPLEAELHLPIELYSRMKPGQKYMLKAEQAIVPRLADPLVGTVKLVDPLIDSASQTFRCVFEIDNPEQKLPAGFPVYLIGPADVETAKAE